jgi:Lantibiotic dehydratase, N terminus
VTRPPGCARLRATRCFARPSRGRTPRRWPNAVDKVAAGAATKPKRARRREEIVASYWQRYCAKNDTIGFFGPLAWGRIADDGPPLHVRSGALIRERSVHLEAWGVQALATSLDESLAVATGPHTERELRTMLEAHPNADVRDRGLTALDRLEAARDTLAAASPEELPGALAALDATFTELTGRDAVRNPGKTYGARTLAYVDCMRDLDVTIGPGLLAGLAPALQVLFEAGRWYCGEVNAVGARIVEDALPKDGSGPFVDVVRRALPALMQEPVEVTAAVAELERRMTKLLADPDPATIGARAIDAFADHRPGWPPAVFQSVDVQIAAPSLEAIAAGDWLGVIGDVHPGGAPVMQGVFAHRAPDSEALVRTWAADVGRRVAFLMPPWGPHVVDARGIGVSPVDAIHIAVRPDVRAQAPRRTWFAHELMVDGTDVVDRGGELRVPVVDAFFLPIYVSGIRAFELLAEADHAPRAQIGNTAMRRESWNVRAADIPQTVDDLPAFARDRGMPRRVFTKSPLERKPMFLDTESATLGRILCRQARQAAAADPEARILISEMLPAPDQCWLHDPDGNRYVAELRLVAVDRTREDRR